MMSRYKRMSRLGGGAMPRCCQVGDRLSPDRVTEATLEETDARNDTMSSGDAPEDEPEWRRKQKEYEIKKARAKALKLRLTCTICGEKAKLLCPCGTTQCAPA